MQRDNFPPPSFLPSFLLPVIVYTIVRNLFRLNSGVQKPSITSYTSGILFLQTASPLPSLNPWNFNDHEQALLSFPLCGSRHVNFVYRNEIGGRRGRNLGQKFTLAGTEVRGASPRDLYEEAGIVVTRSKRYRAEHSMDGVQKGVEVHSLFEVDVSRCRTVPDPTIRSLDDMEK